VATPECKKQKLMSKLKRALRDEKKLKLSVDDHQQFVDALKPKKKHERVNRIRKRKNLVIEILNFLNSLFFRTPKKGDLG